ncbi:MAG TPA: tetratricopeptide repeat protein [Verrucomicrobiota bacterium]|jgi:tetratricopeptide (TPR) repeat protein|nr:tetratricopeptide repeat protein [Verrucomicrobiota bacterium]
MNPHRRSYHPRNWLALTLGLLTSVLLFAGSGIASEAQFEEANRLYETGEFAEAAALYRAATTNGVSASLLFNLGNAHFKAGQLGQAMAAYHRSLRLEPRNPETTANLRFAREKASAQPPPLTVRQRWLRRLSLGEWTALASMAATLLLLLLTTRQLKPRSFEGKPLWIQLPTAVALATAFLLAMAASDFFSDHRAFVRTEKAVVRNGPLEESPESFKTTDGTELLVHDRKGDFLEIETGIGQKGWIHSGDVEPLLP